MDFEEAVRRAQAFDALMRSLVVVILNPEFDPLASALEAVELGAAEELLPDAFPEPFDLAQRHRMVGSALEVGHAILFQLGLETTGAAPRRILSAIVGEHLFGRLKLARGHSVNLDDRRSRGTTEQIRPHDEARIIVQKGDQIGVTPAQPEGENVRLPHLIGRGPFEETWPGHVAFLGRRGCGHQVGLMQMLAHRLGAGG